jgi:hypothetical protein
MIALAEATLSSTPRECSGCRAFGGSPQGKFLNVSGNRINVIKRDSRSLLANRKGQIALSGLALAKRRVRLRLGSGIR